MMTRPTDCCVVQTIRLALTLVTADGSIRGFGEVAQTWGRASAASASVEIEPA
jgi:hypothetical protein